MIPKFRVWDKLKKDMSEVECISFVDNKVYTTFNNSKKLYIPMEEAVLMQSTGLKDKNNVDIYTGDMLDIKANFKRLGFVIFDHGKFKVQHVEDTVFYDFTQVLSQCEVIGNVFENKELLGDTDA